MIKKKSKKEFQLQKIAQELYWEKYIKLCQISPLVFVDLGRAYPCLKSDSFRPEDGKLFL